MRFPIFGAENGNPSNTSTTYAYLSGNFTQAWNATENQRQQVIGACTGRGLKVTVTTAPGVGKSWVFTVRKGGVATGLTVTIADTATSAAITGLSVGFADLDLFVLEAVPSGTPTNAGITSWYMDVETADNSCFIIGTSSNASATATQYAIPCGSSSAWEATVTAPELVCGAPGNLVGLLFTAPIGSPGGAGSGKSYALSVRVANTTDALTATMLNTATTASATGSQAVTAGQGLVIKCVPSGTPTARRLTWCVVFQPTTEGEMPVGWYSTVDPGNTTVYDQPYGDGAGSFTTEGNRQMKLPPCTLRSMYVKLAPASGVATSRTVTIRKNTADTALTVVLANVNTGNITGTDVAVVDTDLISMSWAVLLTPAAGTNERVGYVMVFPQFEPRGFVNFQNPGVF